MEQEKVYDLIDMVSDPIIKSQLFDCYDIILKKVSSDHKDWIKYPVRSKTKASRLVNTLTFIQDGNGGIILPESFCDILPQVKIIINELVNAARLTITPTDKIIPIEIFLCYYQNGNDVCPMHSHKCRQITLSIGNDRTMTIESKRVTLHNGSIIYLHRQKHGILAEENIEGNRVSFNLFYTITNERDSVPG